MPLVEEDSYNCNISSRYKFVAVPEINLSKLEHTAQRLTRCVSESRPSQLMNMMISASITHRQTRMTKNAGRCRHTNTQ